MPVFVFEAVNRGGKRVRGELTAQSRAEVFKKLDVDRLQPIKIEEKDGVNGRKQAVAERAVTTKFRLSRTQIIRFTEELSDLLDAGLQIDPALQVMEKRKELSALKSVAGALRSHVREGSSLSSAISRSEAVTRATSSMVVTPSYTLVQPYCRSGTIPSSTDAAFSAEAALPPTIMS